MDGLKKISLLADQVLKGIGQIMLQENRLTGLLFLVGITLGSPLMGVAVVLAATTATLAARLLQYDKENIDKGLYGFSAALVGVAMILIFQPVFLTWIFILPGAVAAAVLQHFFLIRKIPVFTLPFVLVTWVFLFTLKFWLPEIPASTTSVTPSGPDFPGYILRGYGQVIFQDSTIAGGLFFAGVFLNAPLAAVYGLAGSFLAGSAAILLSVPVSDINMGLLSFNAVLCAIVFSGRRKKDLFLAFLAVCFAFILSSIMLRLHLPQLTFPFVVASMSVIGLDKKFGRKKARFPGLIIPGKDR